MKVVNLSSDYLEAFKAYCLKHKFDHDESYLDDDEVNSFVIDKNNPTVLLLDHNKLVGVLSCMLDDYFVKAKKTRVRIFHSEQASVEAYRALLMALDFQMVSIDKLELFMPDRVTTMVGILADLGFYKERTSYVMVREGKPPIEPNLPEDYVLKPLKEGQEEVYAHIRNTAFKHLKGSEVGITDKEVRTLLDKPWNIKNGTQFLYHHDQAIGLVRVIEEKENDKAYSFVQPIALLPHYQGRGLGLQLLYAGIAIGQNVGLNECMLVVNAENDQALNLYKKAGFEILEAVGCYHYTL